MILLLQVSLGHIPARYRRSCANGIREKGGSAAAAGNLVQQLGGQLVGYVFIMELDFLKGRDKLNAPVHTLLSGQDEALQSSK